MRAQSQGSDLIEERMRAQSQGSDLTEERMRAQSQGSGLTEEEQAQSQGSGLTEEKRTQSQGPGLTEEKRAQVQEPDLTKEEQWEKRAGSETEERAQVQESDLTAKGLLPVQRGIPELKELEFRHVTFRYPGTDVDILKDFSMKLENGRHYAIVGENGAGKTTLIKLLIGLYREYEGEVLYNGVEMRSFSREGWFKIFSCVFQDFARYYLSVEENICLGMGNMDFEEEDGPERKRERISRMEGAARQLDIHAYISDLKNGYKTRLGKLDEDSVDLSGGQWQRVAMARALMNDAPLLLLDEPTAALDPISESRLYEEFNEISRNRTTIFISHRLGSIKLSDHIFLLKDGCVREQGSHEELMKLQGIYANMYETQQSWYNQENGADMEVM